MKKIKLKDIDLIVNRGTIMYVTVDVFRFVKDESLPCVEVEIEENGEYKLFEELDEDNIVANHNDLKKIALNWVFNNVEVV